MVIRVFPVVGITAPRFPLEKSYTFFIISPLFGVGLPHRDGSRATAPRTVNHDHQRPDRVHSNGDNPLLALSSVILDGERAGGPLPALAPGGGGAVFGGRFLRRAGVEFGGHT